MIQVGWMAGRECLLTKLSGGDRRSIGRADEVAAEVAEDLELFAALMEAVEHQDDVVRMRASDALEKVTRAKPDLLCGYECHILNTLAQSPQQEVRWHMAQIIPRLRLSAERRQHAVNILTGYLEDDSRIVQTFAMQALADLSEGDPELRRTAEPLIRSLVESGSPAVKARGRRLLDRMERTAN